MFLYSDYCYSSTTDLVNSISSGIYWNGELITSVSHDTGQIFSIITDVTSYSYVSPDCLFDGPYPPDYPFDIDFLGMLFAAALVPFSIAWALRSVFNLF